LARNDDVQALRGVQEEEERVADESQHQHRVRALENDDRAPERVVRRRSGRASDWIVPAPARFSAETARLWLAASP